MSIAICIFCDVTSGGGVYVYSKNLLSAFSKDEDIEFFLISHAPRSREDEERLRRLEVYCNDSLVMENGMRSHEVLSKIESYLDKLKPSWYIPNYRDEPHAAIIKCKRNGTKVMFVCHNDSSNQYQYAVRYQDLIDLYVAPSKKCEKTLRALIENNYLKNIKYIPHYVEGIESQPIKKINNNKIVIIYHGRISFDQKQLWYLADIAELLLTRSVIFHLYMVGDGPDKERLEKLFKDKGISDDCYQFTGYVDHSSIYEYFSLSHVGILVSEHEGFCLSLAEAMRNGLPAIAFDCGGVINDYLIDGSNGMIVPQSDVEAVVDSIEILSKDHSLYSKYSECAYKVMKNNFSILRFHSEYSKAFKLSREESCGRWPSVRPKLIPRERYSLPYMVEKLGIGALGWRSLESMSFKKIHGSITRDG